MRANDSKAKTDRLYRFHWVLPDLASQCFEGESRMQNCTKVVVLSNEGRDSGFSGDLL